MEVIYWDAFPITADMAADPQFSTGYEVELRYSNGADVYITWQQNIIWNGADGMIVQMHSSFGEGTCYGFIANETPLWQSAIDTVLREVEILGWNPPGAEEIEVLAAKLCFDRQRVYVGVGIGGRMSDGLHTGDDVLVRSEQDFFAWPLARDGRILWSSSEIE